MRECVFTVPISPHVLTIYPVDEEENQLHECACAYLLPISSTANDSRRVISRNSNRNLLFDLSCIVYIVCVLFLSKDLSVLFVGAEMLRWGSFGGASRGGLRIFLCRILLLLGLGRRCIGFFLRDSIDQREL